MEEIKAGFKRCCRCGKIKSLAEFYDDKTRKDGKECYCKICISEINKKKWKSMTKEQRNKEKERKRKLYNSLTKEQKNKRKKDCTEWLIKNLVNWEPIVKKLYGIKGKFRCEVCGKTLDFPQWGNGINNINKTLCFDHKNNNVAIERPATWLRGHSPTPINIELFKSCGFGILCNQCNVLLGSPQNRKERIKQQIRYIWNNKNKKQQKRQQMKTKTLANSEKSETQTNKETRVLTPLTTMGVISEMSFISLCDRCKNKNGCKFYDKVISLRNKELQKEDNNLQLYTYCCPDYEKDVEFYKENKDVLVYLNKVARRV